MWLQKNAFDRKKPHHYIWQIQGLSKYVKNISTRLETIVGLNVPLDNTRMKVKTKRKREKSYNNKDRQKRIYVRQ